MKNKKIPLRTCVVTKEKLEKKDLIRVVKNNENEVFVDLTGKANGRGAYIKKDIDVLNKARKSKILGRRQIYLAQHLRLISSKLLLTLESKHASSDSFLSFT